MKATAWHDGGSVYGIRVGIPNRDQFFDRRWTQVEVEMDGRFYEFALTSGFWRRCPEFCDRGDPVIREWLKRHRTLNWPKGKPPHMDLVSLGGGRFRLEA